MIVADTSAWVNHFRRMETELPRLLTEGIVLLHPFVLGELLLHGLPKHGEAADAIVELGPAPLATPPEVAAFIGWAKLAGKGIGYVDVHLLVSAKMLSGGRVLTHDKRLRAQSERLGIGYAS